MICTLLDELHSWFVCPQQVFEVLEVDCDFVAFMLWLEIEEVDVVFKNVVRNVIVVELIGVVSSQV